MKETIMAKCSYCGNDMELNKTKKFNFKHNLTKNVTCCPLCQRLKRIEVEFNNK